MTKGSSRGHLILLRAPPRSGISALATALNERCRHWSRLRSDFTTDLDLLTEHEAPGDTFAEIASDQHLRILKTHLSASAFVSRYPQLAQRVLLQVMLFRTPIDVATSTYIYLSSIPGTLAPDELRFSDFFRRWVREGGNAQCFEDAGFSSWEQYASEALSPVSPIPGEVIAVSCDEVNYSLDRAAQAIHSAATASWAEEDAEHALASASTRPEVTLVMVPTVPRQPYVGSGRWGDLMVGGDSAEALLGYLDRFAPTVNRLIRERAVPLASL
jgi:hypothetical protein